MALSARTLPRDLRLVPNALPDDTEDTIERRQEAGGALASALAALAERRGASWGVCEEVDLSGLQHLDGRTARVPTSSCWPRRSMGARRR